MNNAKTQDPEPPKTGPLERPEPQFIISIELNCNFFGREQTVEGEVPEGAEDGGAWGEGAMAWTEGSGEAVLKFNTQDERDDALDALVKATDQARDAR